MFGVASTARGLRRRLGHRLNAANPSEVAPARAGSVHIDVTSQWGRYFTLETLLHRGTASVMRGLTGEPAVARPGSQPGVHLVGEILVDAFGKRAVERCVRTITP